ncbi:hypothetical protein GJAV_G00205040 [Gymnothorax javanicus]|nr:hypothetical protein GJAV_G00205040 [Gymnothorax javanicus]
MAHARVEKLPANPLQEPLLEGLSQGSRGSIRAGSGTLNGLFSSDQAVSRTREAHYFQSPQCRQKPDSRNPLNGGSSLLPGVRKPSSNVVSTAMAMALTSAESKQSSDQQVSISVCMMQMVGVYGKFKEGWLHAVSLRTGKVGILPANYVTPVLRTSARFLDPRSIQSWKSATGKRPGAVKPHGVALTNGTVRPVGNIPFISMTAPGSVMRGAHQKGAHSRSFRKHKRSSMRESVLRQNPAPDGAVVRPSHPVPSGVFGQMQSSSCIPTMQQGKHGSPENVSISTGCTSRATAPSAGDYLVLDLRGTPANELPDRQGTAELQSILVKPEAHKNNMDKPMKTVRFLAQESPETRQKMVSLLPEGLGGSSVQPISPGQTPSTSTTIDGSAATLKKVLVTDPTSVDGLPLRQKSASTALAQPNACRCRVMAAYTAQTDSELHLREGELVLVQKLRQGSRVLVTQEKGGKTGLFQSIIWEVLEELS